MWTKKHVLVTFAAVFVALAVAPLAMARGLTPAGTSLLRAVNAARVAHHLRPLRADATLARAARSHSQDMLAHGYFAHGAFTSRMAAFHARGPLVGENLAWGVGSYASPATIVREWLASPEHRRNLLRPGFVRIGIGEAVGSFQGHGGAIVVTADFAGY
jgi:uncharacterized protein YkwD